MECRSIVREYCGILNYCVEWCTIYVCRCMIRKYCGILKHCVVCNTTLCSMQEYCGLSRDCKGLYGSIV